ncbi:MAG TPA: YigZ family protein [Longimicrobiales bacterium]|nr:YigZ family protein [Longimicrobiales bacterium]
MTETEYRIPAERYRTEQVIDRSRFIATVAPADSPEAARGFIDDVREEFPDATHNCWAFVAGPPGSTRAIGMSDDGEPHGTAGRPMLDVLLHSGLGEVAAVVTRYYGGVKLGKGGLVRAYGGAVQHALEMVPTVLLTPTSHVEIVVAYSDVDMLRRLVAEHGGAVAGEDYGAEVTWRVGVPTAALERFRRLLADRTAGRARLRADDDEESTG